MNRNKTLALQALVGGLLCFGWLVATHSVASAAPTGTAVVAATPTAITAPGTFQVSGQYTYDPGVPVDPTVQSVKVRLELAGTDGVVALSALTPSSGLQNCQQVAAPRDFECEVTDITSAGSFTLSATATASSVPTGGVVFLQGFVVVRSNDINRNLAVATEVQIGISTAPPPTTAPPTTAPPTTATIPTTTAPAAGAPTAPSTTSAPIGLPATGSREDRTALFAGLFVLAGVVALAASRARRSDA